MVSNEIHIDRSALERDLKDVGDYLAELKFIDLSLQHIVDRNHEIGARGEQTGLNHVEVTLGTQYPFVAPAIAPPITVSTQTELAAFDVLASQASRWASNEMDFVHYLVREIMYYPISGYTPMDASLESVWSTLETRVADDFGYLGDEIADWSGPAASEFKSLFYNKLPQARRNQKALVRTLQGALETSRRIVEYSQQSVINAVASSREALREQLYLRSVGDTSTVSAKVALLVVGGALTVLGTLTAGATLWAAATATGLGYAAGAAASELPAEHTEQRDIAGRSAEEIHISLFDAIRDTGIFLGRELDYLHDDLRDAHREISELHQNHDLLPRRPRLADGVGGADFYHDSSDQYP